MGRTIVKQPDGLFACYASYCDMFVYANLTKEELIEILAQDAYEHEKERLEMIIKNEESCAFKKWEDALSSIKFYHKKKGLDEVLSKIKRGDKEL